MSTQTEAPKTRREPQPLNGVNTPALFATIDAVAGQRELASFRFRATNQWVKGTQSRTRMEKFSGAGGDHEQTQEFSFAGDHPPVLCGEGVAPTPIEFLLHGLASCLTAGIGNIAAARGVELESVESTVEGDIDLQGLLGLSDEIRNGYQAIRVNFKVKGDAPAEKLRQIVEQSKARSAVLDVLTNGTRVDVTVDAA